MNHVATYRVYYEDTDAGGVMYHANYLKFCERGRTEFLHALGYTNASLREETGVIFVVRHIDAHYLRPCYLEDALTVRSAVTGLKNASFTMRQEILRQGADDPAFYQDIVLVCVDEDAKPVGMPPALRASMEPYQGKKQQ
ncbi:MAG: YbgC/FadM family acyl-CoA thioesterase [Alphaproteobacteria bacterium]|nr:YbgC/FadM family acyl-CoA thioesterase [Alphaproteobacteria bacterium]